MTERRYRFCPDPDRIVLRRFDGDESVLAFNCASGDTHLLSAFDHLLLTSLRKAVLSNTELAAMLRPQLLVEELPVLDEVLSTRLGALLALGLIEPAA